MPKEIATYGYLQVRAAMSDAINSNELTTAELAKIEKVMLDALDNLQGFIPAHIIKA